MSSCETNCCGSLCGWPAVSVSCGGQWRVGEVLFRYNEECCGEMEPTYSVYCEAGYWVESMLPTLCMLGKALTRDVLLGKGSTRVNRQFTNPHTQNPPIQKWQHVSWRSPHFGACPKSSNVSNSYNMFSLFVILFINFLTKVSMYE